MNLSTKQKQIHRHSEQTDGCQGGGSCWGGMVGEFGVSRRKPVYTEWISNKVLLCRTGNYIQYPGINHNGKEYKQECVYIYIYIYIYIYMYV